MHIRKKDKVVVISGVERGKTGEVLRTFAHDFRAIVAGVNLVKKHVRSTREKPGGINQMEAPLHISKLALICPKCNQPNRAKAQFLSDGSRVRLCRKCGENIL